MDINSLLGFMRAGSVFPTRKATDLANVFNPDPTQQPGGIPGAGISGGLLVPSDQGGSQGKLGGLLGDPLFNMGIAMMGSRSPHLGGALADGLQGAQGAALLKQRMADQEVDSNYKRALIEQMRKPKEVPLTEAQRNAMAIFPNDPEKQREYVLSVTSPDRIKPPSSVQEYEYAKSQGYQGNYFDFIKDARAAGKSEVVVNLPPMEKKYDETIGKTMAERFETIQQGGIEARNKMATYQALANALDAAGYTGFGAENLLALRRAAQAVGLSGDKLDEKIGAAEAARAIGNQLALKLRNPSGGAGMPGALSDKDREFLVASTPGLTKTPEGNRRLIDVAMRLEQRNVDVARLAMEYARQNGGRLDVGFYTALQDYADQNPLFSDLDAGGGAEGGQKRRLRYDPARGFY